MWPLNMLAAVALLSSLTSALPKGGGGGGGGGGGHGGGGSSGGGGHSAGDSGGGGVGGRVSSTGSGGTVRGAALGGLAGYGAGSMRSSSSNTAPYSEGDSNAGSTLPPLPPPEPSDPRAGSYTLSRVNIHQYSRDSNALNSSSTPPTMIDFDLMVSSFTNLLDDSSTTLYALCNLTGVAISAESSISPSTRPMACHGLDGSSIPYNVTFQQADGQPVSSFSIFLSIG